MNFLVINSIVLQAIFATTKHSALVVSTSITHSNNELSKEDGQYRNNEGGVNDIMTKKSKSNANLPQSLRRRDLLGNGGGPNDIAKSALEFFKSIEDDQEYIDLSSTPPHSLKGRNLEAWVTQVGGNINGAAAGDSSGFSVSMSEDSLRVAIGSPGHGGISNNIGWDKGHARVFDYDPMTNVWTQVGQDIDGEDDFNSSGYEVSLSADGKRVAVGAPENDDGVNNCYDDYSYKYYNDCEQQINSGHARVFELINSQWIQIGQDIDGSDFDDRLGETVALSSTGSRLVVGAPKYYTWQTGYVKVFDFVNNFWSQVGQTLNASSAGDDYGDAVAISYDGSTVAIGTGQNDGGGSNAGHVQVFRLNNNNLWVQVGQNIEGLNPADYFGRSVALNYDGTRVAIGALYDAARVFDLGADLVWYQVGQSMEGREVAMSSDGSTVAVGYEFDSGGGTNAGVTRVFRLYNNNWVQVVDNIYGEATFDSSGNAISLSYDGLTIAIGSKENDGGGISSGHTRVFTFDTDIRECLNSIMSVYLDDGTNLSCVEAANNGLCETSTDVQSHCPNQCDTCLTYKCRDSTASLNANGATCALLQTFPEDTINLYCGIYGVLRSCRGTCNYCFS